MDIKTPLTKSEENLIKCIFILRPQDSVQSLLIEVEMQACAKLISAAGEPNNVSLFSPAF